MFVNLCLQPSSPSAAWQQHASSPLLLEYMLAAVTFLLSFGERFRQHVRQAHWDAIIDLSEVASQADFLVEDQDVMADAER